LMDGGHDRDSFDFTHPARRASRLLVFQVASRRADLAI
jgi:hypothetical protein